VRLEVLDPAGMVVRSFASNANTVIAGPGEQGMRGPPQGGSSAGGLSATAGLNTFTWDLRHPGPDNGTGRPVGQGPMVPPGRYQVRLSIGDWSARAPLVIRADPRVTADGVTDAVLAEQAALGLRARDFVSEVNRTVARLRDLKRTAPELGNNAVFAEAERALITAGGAYPTPMLQDQAMYLYSLVNGADQQPGRDVTERLAELTARHQAILARLGALSAWYK
jgi:hypothetical protein